MKEYSNSRSARPTPAALLAAAHKSVPDLIANGLDVLFVGINPGLYSAAVGHHFARPGNRFWPALYAGGFTPRLFEPAEERELIGLGLGISNVIDRASARADELLPHEYLAGSTQLTAKVERYRPRVVAFLGVGAYRMAFARPRAQLGRQPLDIAGAVAWVLPNPSGLNAHYQKADLARLFAELRTFLRS